jgi:uncharacterized protein (DUF362 family)
MKPRVILRACDDYELAKLRDIIATSIDELGIEPSGRVFIKPNVVTASRRYIQHSYTHPLVVEAMLEVLKQHRTDHVVVGESGGYGVPSRLFLKEAGYFDLGRRQNVDVIDLNEHAVDRVKLTRAVCHEEVMLPRAIGRADFKIWMPKLKYHIFAHITNALKLNIGILTHEERMLFHDHRIHEKIVDLLEPGHPDLIVSDAIDITYGYESAPYPVRLGALLISNDPLAVDVVAATIMGYDAKDVRHLRIAHERGYGSLDLEDISVEGDIGIDELRSRPKGNSRLFQHLDELDTPIRFFAGVVPGTDIVCDGGCEAAIKGCLGTIEKRAPGSLKRARPGALVHGVYAGDVVVPDGPAVLVGDCTEVRGRLEAKTVKRIKGCPIGTMKLFFDVPRSFGLPTPLTDPRDGTKFVYNSLARQIHRARNRISERRRASS